MSDLTGRTQNDTFKDLLHFENSNLGFDGTLRQIESGNGVGSTLSLSTIGAAIAGTLAVGGLASFTLTPQVSGNVVWHAGNDGAGSGLDADTLQGDLPSAFLKTTSNATITGNWGFSQSVLLSAVNNTELMRFNDTSNAIQMLASFNASLDFSMVPATGGAPEPENALFYDSSLARWSVNTDLAINKVNGKMYINTAGGQLPVMSVETTLGDGVLLGDAGFDTFMTSADGSVNILGLAGEGFDGGIKIRDGANIRGRVGYFPDIFNTFIIESSLPSGFGITLTTDGDEILIEATAGEVKLNNLNGLALITEDYTALTSTSSAAIRDGGGVQRYAGFNAMPPTGFSIATNLLSANVGHKMTFTGASSVALTVSGDANIPVGACWVLANVGTDVFTMATTGITLNWLDGGGATAPTGARTLAIAGIASLVKRATGVYDIWGAGLT